MNNSQEGQLVVGNAAAPIIPGKFRRLIAKYGRLAVLGAVGLCAYTSVQAAVELPANIEGAIDTAELVFTTVAGVVVSVALFFVAIRFVKRIK